MYNQWAEYERALDRLDLCEKIRLALPHSNARLIELRCDRIGVLINCQKWPEAFDQLDDARSLLPRLSDKAKWLEGYVDCRAGFIQLHLGDLTESLSLLLRAEMALTNMPNTQNTLKSQYLLALTLSGLGDLYERLDMGEESMESYNRIIPIIETHKLAPRRAFHYINAGRANLAQGQTAGAIEYFKQALELAGIIDKVAFTHAALNLAPALIMANKDSQAIQLFETVSEQFAAQKTPEDLLNLSKIEIWKAEIWLKAEDYQHGETACKNAWEYALQSGDTAQQLEVCQYLAGMAVLKSDYQTAYNWQSKASALQTKEYRQLLDRERNELKTLHNLEKSRQENRIIKLHFSSLQQKALRAQMNPHFLFNALNGIQGIILTGKHKEAVTYLAQFSKLMRKTLYYSETESLSLKEEMTFLRQYLDLNNHLRFEGHLRYDIQIHPDIDPEEVAIPAMILQPLVENAIEHGLRPNQGGLLQFRVFPDAVDLDLIVCEIEDDGIGPIEVKRRQEEYAESQEHRSRGMEITLERLKLLHERMGRMPREWITVHDRSTLGRGDQHGALAIVMLPDMNAEE